jgi:cytochrome c553
MIGKIAISPMWKSAMGWLGLAVLMGTGAAAAADPTEFFETRVRPVLANNCYSCHANSELGGLRLDSRERILKGGKSGAAVIPGKPDESLLIRAIRQVDSRLKMPLGGKLTDEEINDLTKWVELGVPWPATPAAPGFIISQEQKHFWAFQPIQQTSPPVSNHTWVKSPIDRFILARLETQAMKPVHPASKQDLIRRATFDLTGLPPTAEEVDAFVRDSSPDAFARVVDRLLASPQYGERWGRFWLDVARYGEDDVRGAVPSGYEPYANAFRYRDWVIGAFNQDMPYDVFVEAQIAGDLLDRKDRSNLVAGLGLFGLGPWYFDLADAPQARANERNDRVDMISRGLLGLTVACARCHDHKYDPISMKDYYALAGVFASSEFREYPLVPQKVIEDYKAHAKKIQDKETFLKEFSDSQSTLLAEMLVRKTSQYVNAAWQVLGPQKAELGQVASTQKLDSETLERWANYLKNPEKDHPYLKDWNALMANGTAEAAARAADNFQATLQAVIDEKKGIDADNRIVLDEARRKRGAPVGFLPNGFALYNGDTDNCFGISVVVKSLERDKFVLWSDIIYERSNGNRAKKEPGVLRYKDEKLERFLSEETRDYLGSLKSEVEAMKKVLPPHYPFLQVLGDAPGSVNLKVHLRGSPYNLGEEVPRRFLAVLSPDDSPQFGRGSGRLELADMIAHHPLAARVMVNRIWAQHFGRGIVGTPSNFGQLGERPSEPELLEYLAGRFVESGYSVKAMHRQIMLSATYQSSAAASAENFAKDPDNRLFWRANRRRLEAEAIRDSILFVSGDLDMKPGGPSAELAPENRRRSVYGKISRFKLDPLLSLFDFPDPGMSAEQRNVTNVPLQGLFFMNSPLVAQESQRLVERLSREAGKEDAARIRRAYELLYSREAQDAEIQAGLEFLRQGASSATAWQQYAQALLASNEFIFLN